MEHVESLLQAKKVGPTREYYGCYCLVLCYVMIQYCITKPPKFDQHYSLFKLSPRDSLVVFSLFLVGFSHDSGGGCGFDHHHIHHINHKYIYGGSFWEMSVRSKVCDWPVFPQNGHFTPAQGRNIMATAIPCLSFYGFRVVAMRLARLKSRGATLRV